MHIYIYIRLNRLNLNRNPATRGTTTEKKGRLLTRAPFRLHMITSLLVGVGLRACAVRVLLCVYSFKIVSLLDVLRRTPKMS